uniref:HECT domain-containing protein n=1 Tax=Neogobius melanostomus TaxID=47308 RepID=A0A8C6WQ02_9GOBI
TMVPSPVLCFVFRIRIVFIIQISESKTLEELRAHCEPLTDYMATAGCLRCLSILMDKDKLVEDILRFEVILRVRGPLQRCLLVVQILYLTGKQCWSEEGSNARVLESQVVAFWRDYLQDAEGVRSLPDTFVHSYLQFNVIPPMGLTPAPTIEFQMGKYPIANTCANCLRLPIHHRYEDFKMNMDFGIQNTQGFGMI